MEKDCYCERYYKYNLVRKMKAIKKLKITFKISLLSTLILFLLFKFKSNIGWGIAFAILLCMFILSKFIFFRNKNVYYEDYSTISLYYVYGAVFLFFAIISSLGTLHDIRQSASIPLWAILVLSGAWIFGILLIYYTYQAKKEYSLKSKSIEKPKKKIEREKITNFSISLLMAFLIIAILISFVFKLFPITLTYILVSIFTIIFMYIFLRKTFLK